MRGTMEQEQRILIAGSGGQGVLTAGSLLCHSGMSRGLKVTYFPSYGAEVRGGTANCHVVISPESISSPYVEAADVLLILNQPSLDRFAAVLKPDGLLVVNSSLASLDGVEVPDCARVMELPATETAARLGNVLVANVVMLGAVAEAAGLLSEETFQKAMAQTKVGKKKDLLELNLQAFREGMRLAREQAARG